MSFSDKISSLQSSAERQLHALGSKKKTENALILPFFNMLGYNPFDVREVEPDYEIGRGEQETETVDYALKKEGSATVLFQCTEAKTDLEAYEKDVRGGSLLEYLDELEADLAAFTNGLTYRFHANLEVDVRGEERPFLEFNLLGYEPDQIETLERLSKSVFDRDEILSAARDLQTSHLLRNYFSRQRTSPDDRFLRFLAAQVYDGEVSGSQLDRLRPLVQKVLGEFGGGEGEEQSVPDQEGRALPEQADETASRDLKAGVEGTLSQEGESGGRPSDEEAPTDEDAEDRGGPFDKDLAQRVIDDF